MNILDYLLKLLLFCCKMLCSVKSAIVHVSLTKGNLGKCVFDITIIILHPADECRYTRNSLSRNENKLGLKTGVVFSLTYKAPQQWVVHFLARQPPYKPSIDSTPGPEPGLCTSASRWPSTPPLPSLPQPHHAAAVSTVCFPRPKVITSERRTVVLRSSGAISEDGHFCHSSPLNGATVSRLS